MAACAPQFRPVLQRDLDAAWAAIGVATVDDKDRAKHWEDWRRYALGASTDPYFRGVERADRQNLLLAFAARVRTGLYGKGRQVGHQSVEKALRHVAQTLQLAGYDDPRKTYGAKELDLPFRHLLKSYKEDDPAPQPQLAIPIPTIQTAASRYEPHHSRHDRAVSDLICMAFFFSPPSGRVHYARSWHQNLDSPIPGPGRETLAPRPAPQQHCTPSGIDDSGLSHFVFGKSEEWPERRHDTSLSSRCLVVLPCQGLDPTRLRHC
jgi:hypothetical protein